MTSGGTTTASGHAGDGAARGRRVGVLHPGQMGVAVAAAASATSGVTVSWVAAGRSDATVRRASAAGLTPVGSLPELVAASDVVLSVCPPAAAEDVAREVADVGFDGVYADLNAVSTDRVRRIAERLGGRGARVVDGSIIGPPPQGGGTARLYLSGRAQDTAEVAALFGAAPVQVVVLSGPFGSASALKMAFAGFQKPARALAAVAHALAARHDVTEELLAEATRMPGAPLTELGYVPAVAARGWRWAPEMLEVADELAAARLPADLALAAAAVLERWAPDRDRWDIGVGDALARLVDADVPPARR